MESPAGRAGKLLRRFALAYPGAHEDFPWGERAIRVGRKVFVFFGRQKGLHMTVKLPSSGLVALSLPFASPTGYGLGKSGWVNTDFAPRERPPVPLLKQWVDESYRAVAPRRLVAHLGAPRPLTSARRRSRAAANPRDRHRRPRARGGPRSGGRQH